MVNFETFQYHFSQLNILATDIEVLMGYVNEETPEYIHQTTNEILKRAEEVSKICGGYQLFDQVIFDSSTHFCIVNQTAFHIDKTIFRQLKKSESVALFVCTAGNEVGQLSNKLLSEGHLLEGYIADIIGSVIVESAMDKIQEELKKEMLLHDLSISNRYSPGYCGWKVDEQLKLFGLLPLSICGISLTKSCLMTPIKSISGVIGIGKEISHTAYSCNICTMENCIYKRYKKTACENK